MIPRYLFLVFLLMVLVVGCSSDEPIPTFRAVTGTSPVTLGPEVSPVEVVTEILVDGFISTEVPVELPAETPVVEEVPTVALVVPTVISEIPSPDVTEVPVVGPELLSADHLLEALIAASTGVETGSYEMSVVSNVEVEGVEISVGLKISGDYQKPDRQQITAEVDASFFKIQVEMVMIGDVVYAKDPITGNWTALYGDLAPRGFHDFLDVVQPSDLLEHLVLAGESVIDGRAVLDLEGEVPAEILGEDGEGIESLWVRYSIGLDDHLLYGSEIRMTDENTTVTTVTFRFFDYGKELDIQAPEVAVEDIGSDVDEDFDCDGILRQQLIFQRWASIASKMNEVIAQLQANRVECPLEFWSPEVDDTHATTTGECFTAGELVAVDLDVAIPVEVPAVTGAGIGGQKVPHGLRDQDSGIGNIRKTSGRDLDNNIIVYWSVDELERPSDGAKCWLYVSRLRSWSGNY